MITKVTSANYNDYTLLFNQADTALKEANGEPTAEFLIVKGPVGEPGDDDYEAGDSFNSTIQYFNELYAPVSFEDAADFNARDLTKTWYRLNEAIIYDLDTYFGNLRVLTNIDYSFLRLPIDEPTFDIVEGGNSGKRVINIPDEFKSGISVQGDETAEILFFSIDRYYDATDLWTAEMNYIIQWQAGSKNGVTKAFINKDGRPFLDNGKLYFGWPISSEITEEAGDVTFSVRIFRFGEGLDENDNPKLAFGLNTQTATVKINESIAFDIKSADEFEGAETISKTPDIISRVFNSTVMAETKQTIAPQPEIIKNILTPEVLATRLSVVPITEDVYTLAVEDFDENETYYNANHEVVTGLNANIYRRGFYYLKDTIEYNYYEFDYVDIYDKLQQIQAISPSGVITYSGMSSAAPGSTTIGGRMQMIGGDDVVYIPVTSETALEDHKYYERDEETGKFMVARNIVTKITDAEWDVDDRNMNMDGHPCKYFERISPKMVLDDTDSPVGCYWIAAYNNEAKKAMSEVDSYRIWIPGPVDLVDETDIDDTGRSFDDEGFIRTILDAEHKANIGLSVTPENNRDSIIYKWYKKTNDGYVLQEDLDTATQELTYTQDLPLVDDKYKVICYSRRNKQDSPVKLEREFRITDAAHKFIFDTVADQPGEREHEIDKVKVITTIYNQPDAYKFKIDFSENLDANDNLNILSDKIAYRFRKRVKDEVAVENIFYNDAPASNWEDNTDFILTTFDELKDLELTIPEDREYFYVEMINIVNEDFSLEDLNADAAALAGDENNFPDVTNWVNKWEPKISRTPYRYVES